jgi:hypothetical protein
LVPTASPLLRTTCVSFVGEGADGVVDRRKSLLLIPVREVKKRLVDRVIVEDRKTGEIASLSSVPDWGEILTRALEEDR